MYDNILRDHQGFLDDEQLTLVAQQQFGVRPIRILKGPLDFAKELVDKFGIELVEGGIFRKDFVWCGDYEGVVLIPEIGRNWIPCDKPAEANEWKSSLKPMSECLFTRSSFKNSRSFAS